MGLQLVKHGSYFNQEFDIVFEQSKPYMSEFQVRSVIKLRSQSSNKEAFNEACNHIHEGLINSISRQLRNEGDRLSELQKLMTVMFHFLPVDALLDAGKVRQNAAGK